MASAQEKWKQAEPRRRSKQQKWRQKRVGRAEYRVTHGSERGEESESVRERARTEAL